MYAVVNDLVQETIGIMKYDIYGHFLANSVILSPFVNPEIPGLGERSIRGISLLKKTAGFPGSRISRDSGSRDCNTTVIILQAS